MISASLLKSPRRVARLSGALILISAAAALLGWSLTLADLRSAIPGLPRMSPAMEAAISLFSLLNVMVFGALILANAALLDRRDSERKLTDASALDQLQRLNLLHEITRAIGGREDLRSIYQVLLRSLEENLSSAFTCICDYDSALQKLTVVHVGIQSQPLAFELALTEQAHIPLDASGLSLCTNGQLLYEPDIASLLSPFPQKLTHAGLRSIVAVPLMVENQVFGVFIAARKDPSAFTGADCEFLRQMCEHVSLAVHQARLLASLQQAYDDLRHTQQAVVQQGRLRALGELASGIAHDINNAISPLGLYTELALENDPHLSPQTRRHLEMIQCATDDVAKTVSRMRDFYRQREPQLSLVPVQMNDLITQVIDLTRARWSDIPQRLGNVIDVRCEFTPGLPPILGAENEIREALINLIFNAVDSMPKGGTLTLQTRVIDFSPNPAYSALRSVALEVVDTGIGMSEETRRRCLEPFFTTKGERGSGLGLAMVYGMVQRHSGDLEIESSVGEGTTIRLTFDAAPPAIVDFPEIMLAPSRPIPTRILVIDDDPLLIRALCEMLVLDGHDVFPVHGGQDGIDTFLAAQLQNHPFEVVITDLGMPRIDGRKVAQAVKTASPRTPVILLTGWGQRLQAEAGVPPEVDHVLGKPTKLRELRAALALCHRSVALQQLTAP
jgi:signal transduction histidine kinase/ActR/RegA family two-component response regulator